MLSSWITGANISIATIAIAASPVVAQIVPDTSLPQNAIVTPDGNLFTIDGGTTAGGNLFHSFSEFSVPTGGAAFFNNSVAIDNIITRVTGGNISSIDGILSANGTANLFLLNPNGFVFGENASLDLGGSLVVSTAGSLQFADGLEFSAIASETSPLLTVSVPVGLQLGTDPGSIVVRGTGNNLTFDAGSGRINADDRPVGLQVFNDRAIVLVGGEIELAGGNLSAFSGAIDLVSASGDSSVDLVPTGTVWQTNSEGIADFENITLSQAASVDVSGNGGGTVRIRSRNLNLENGSAILAETLGSDNGNVIDIRTTEAVGVGGASPLNLFGVLSTETAPGSTGNGGNIAMEAGTVLLRDGTFVSTVTHGEGNSGDITIRSRDRVELSGLDVDGFGSILNTGIAPVGMGNGGDLIVETATLAVRDGASITASTQGMGDGGNITIRASDRIEIGGLDGSGFGSILSAEVVPNATGNAGNIDIETRELSLGDGGQIVVSTFGNGNSGNLSIVATDAIALSGLDGEGFGSTLSSQVNPEAIGNSGAIALETGQLTLQDGAIILSTTFSRGNAGNISIVATDAIALRGSRSVDDRSSSIVSQVDLDGIGNAGNIDIDTGTLLLDEGTFITSGTLGNGNAGNISVVAADNITLQGLNLEGGPSQIQTEVGVSSAIGNAGDITIETGQLRLDNGAGILSTVAGTGEGGNLTIVASDSVTLSGERADGVFGSRLQTNVDSTGTGNAGAIAIETGRLLLQDGGEVNSESRGMGDAGEINIVATDAIELNDNSAIAARIFDPGRGRATGNASVIHIETGDLTLRDRSFLLSTTGGSGDNLATGNANDIIVSADRVLISQNSEISALSEGGGDAGSAIVFADELTLEDAGQIRVGAIGDALAGNIVVRAEDIFLRDGAIMEANIESGGGGNINIEGDRLVLRRRSNINTNATGSATGGNITLTTDVLAALENSDITANSEQDAGGNVIINTQGIFGTEFREFQTPASDLTATGATQELQGTVQVNTPDIDATSGLVDLPTDVVDAASLIGQDPCSQGSRSEFVITGRGGLPPSPFDPLGGSAPIAIEWVEFNDPPSVSSNLYIAPEETDDRPFREAGGWTIAPDGTISLYANRSPSLRITDDRCEVNRSN